MRAHEGEEVYIKDVPNYAVFHFLKSTIPGLRYQRVGKKLWPIGFTRFPERDVRSGQPAELSSIRWLTEVKIESLFEEPLPHVPRAEKAHDFSFYP